MAATEFQPDRVVGVSRRIRASRAFLFKAWTEPDRFVRWFGPKNWTVERCELDTRPGGAWRVWLKRSDGAGICVGGIYTDVIPDRRIVFTWDNDAQGRPSKTLSIVTIEFVDCTDVQRASKCALPIASSRPLRQWTWTSAGTARSTRSRNM
jgi:uncharacterized protein YndB with AHSA1/START domain